MPNDVEGLKAKLIAIKDMAGSFAEGTNGDELSWLLTIEADLHNAIRQHFNAPEGMGEADILIDALKFYADKDNWLNTDIKPIRKAGDGQAERHGARIGSIDKWGNFYPDAGSRAHYALAYYEAKKQQPRASSPTGDPFSWYEDKLNRRGFYYCKCLNCENIFMGNKQRVICKKCAMARESDTVGEDVITHECFPMMKAIVSALEPFCRKGEKVIWREPFRWKDTDGVLCNCYEMFDLPSVCAQAGLEVVHDFNHIAIVRKPPRAVPEGKE